MTTDIFVKIDAIEGEAQDSAHKGEYDVLTWSWTMSQSGTAHEGTGGGTGKVRVGDLAFTKYYDKASPVLMKMCCTGHHFRSAVLTVRKAGGKALDYLRLKLSNGLITSVSLGGEPDDDRLTETIMLSFESFTYEYVPQAKDGGAQGLIPASWNIAKNAEA